MFIFMELYDYRTKSSPSSVKRWQVTRVRVFLGVVDRSHTGDGIPKIKVRSPGFFLRKPPHTFITCMETKKVFRSLRDNFGFAFQRIFIFNLLQNRSQNECGRFKIVSNKDVCALYYKLSFAQLSLKFLDLNAGLLYKPLICMLMPFVGAYFLVLGWNYIMHPLRKYIIIIIICCRIKEFNKSNL